MATANPLEEQISCSVCFEVFRSPHMLRECMHTFCHPCIQQLERNGQVDPECRTVTLKRHIKRDFKIQGFIDVFNKEREDIRSRASVTGQRETGSKKCQMCKKGNRRVKYHCHECCQFMCEECQTTHKGMRVCQAHTVKSIGQIFKDSETQIKKVINYIEREKKDITTESQNIDKNIEEIRRIETRQIQDVEKYSDDFIQNVKKNEKRLKEMIKDANATVIRSLQERKQVFNKSKDEIQAKVNFLEDLIKEQDLDVLTESMENIKLNTKESVDQIKAALPSRDVLQSPVQVQKGADLDIKDCIQVTIDGSLYGSQEVKPVLQSLFSDLCDNEYIQSDDVDLDYYPYKLMEVNNEIWCGGFTSDQQGYIHVYNQQCQKVNTITHRKLQNFSGFCVTPTKEVIVSCHNNKSLHQLDIQGTYQVQLAQGEFADVCYHEGKLYALQCSTKPKLMVFKKTNKWKFTRSFELCYTNGDDADKLCIHKTGIYISSCLNKCIYVYNFQGQLLEQVDQDRSELFVCGVNEPEGNILVADRTNHRIKLYNKQTGWRVVPVYGEIKQPCCTLIDRHGNTWVGNFRYHSQNKLLKFVKQ